MRAWLAWPFVALALLDCAAAPRVQVAPQAEAGVLTDAERDGLNQRIDAALAKPLWRPTFVALIAEVNARVTPTVRELPLLPGFLVLAQRLSHQEHEKALATLQTWRDRTSDPKVESALCLLLAQTLARQGRVETAALQMRRHLRTGTGVGGESYLWAGTIALAQSQHSLAAVHFNRALQTTSFTRVAEDEAVRAQAALGLALAHDLQGNDELVQHALALASLYDAGDRMRNAACDGRLDAPALSAAQSKYVCNLATFVLRFSLSDLPTPFAEFTDPGGLYAQLPFAWQKRVQHWQAPLGKPNAARGPLRLLAVATTRADGPWPAILIDVSWHQPDAFKDCLVTPPAAGLQRLLFKLRLSPEGRLLTLEPQDNPPAWAAISQCFQRQMAALLTLPPAPPGEVPPGDTLALVEILVTSP
ncbi:MAG: hypothetical protein SF187_04095 [Deltaproteobacteria bacterium]|nr:hypothetical protein [Deltaproteobacteria bacterium]